MESNRNSVEYAPRAQKMHKAIIKWDLEAFLKEMQKVFTSIPYQLDDATEARYHGLFQAMTILACSPPGMVQSENANALGRSDLVVNMPDACWIFEFKRDTDTAEALRQITEKEYDNVWEGQRMADGKEKPIKKVAVTFGTEKRNIIGWEIG